ncbi:MAG: SAM-dependent chlorinase/fluorinase [Deltaproteobacteria bacterium]|nr:SAM-dependent chlorinase/fluorinase [Deltaproteobacteria bacterium]
MSIITLLTDFGTKDAYVGIMKGVILSINPSAVVVDVCHYIDPQDWVEAAYLIKSSYRYFPKGTVHIIVVDPGVGGDRSIVAVELSGHIFLAPDNGVLTLLIDEGETGAMVRVENTRYFLNSISRTFHGRDIFAPVGSHISKGVPIEKLGPHLDKQDLIRLGIPKPYISNKGELIGTIISIDRFGNCISNINENCLNKFVKNGPEKRLEIKTGKTVIKSLSRSYTDVGSGYPLAIIGSFGYLEIALNCDNAGRRLSIEKGDTIILK